MQVSQYPKNTDGTPMDLLVGVLTDASGNGGARLTDAPVGPDKAPIDAVGLVLVDSAGLPATPLTAKMFVASVAEAKALNPTTYPQIFLTEAGRAGLFTKKNYVDYINLVAADTVNGLAIRSTSDTSVVWIRQFDGPVNPLWFGIVEGDAGGANRAGNTAAFNALRASLVTRAKNIFVTQQTLEPIRFPFGYFEFNQTVELDQGAFIIEGAGGGSSSLRGTILAFPAGVTGLRVQASNTTGVGGVAVASHPGGSGSIIRDLCLTGAFVDTEAEAHGIHLRGRAIIKNVYIQEFEGDGIFADATAGGATEGNTNNTIIIGGRIQECRNGIFVDGADVNIWAVIAVDVSSNRQWGILDSSFLGNSYFACHAASNGFVVGNTTPSTVSLAGLRYFVIAGQEVGASTNSPSGTATDNTWWEYLAAGGVSAAVPAWVSGMVVRAGGAYRTDNVNADNLFTGCYYEGGQGRAQMVRPTLVIGGTLGGALSNTSTATSQFGDTLGTIVDQAVGFKRTTATSISSALVGEVAIGTTILQYTDSVAFANKWRLKQSGNDIRADYANASPSFWITGPVTANQFGTGAIVAHAFYPPKLMVGDTIANARQISNGTVLPAANAHGAGELVINRTPAVGGIAAWICRTAGTPGTWEAFGIVGAVRSAAPAVTYAAPAVTYVAASGGTTIDTQARASQVQLAADVAALRASLAQLAVDNADLRTKLAAANLTA